MPTDQGKPEPDGGRESPTVSSPLNPIYTFDSVRPVHRLRYDWSAWWRSEDVEITSTHLEAAIALCRPPWAEDGLVADTWRLLPDSLGVQILFTSGSEISPAHCAHRAKGRLDHAFRQLGVDCRFQRNLGFRSLGDNTREVVEGYIARQASKSNYADPRFKAYLTSFTAENVHAMLDAPAETRHGRYWYNLHLVLVVADRRFPIARHENFGKLLDACFRIAGKKGHALAAASIMPDHIHLALRGNHQHSPLEIGLGFLNNLAYVLGYNRCWSEEFYVGTFGEYGLDRLPGHAEG